MKNLMKFAASFVLALVLAVAALGQNTTTSTTLSTNILAGNASGGGTQQWCLASATNVTVPSIGQTGSLLGVDKEIAQVTSAGATSTCFNVKRGQSSYASAHISGATVYVGYSATGSGDSSRPFTGGPFTSTLPTGYCVRTIHYTLPLVYTGASDVLKGDTFDCINQQWTDTTALVSRVITGGTQVPAAAATAATGTLTVSGGVGSAQTATTGTGGAGAADSVTGGTGGAGGSSSGTGGAGGAESVIGGTGGGTVTGGAGGATVIAGGAGGIGSGAGGNGGAVTVRSGAAGTGGTGVAGNVKFQSGATVLYDASVAGTGGIASAYFCGATSGTTTCPNTATAGGARMIGGIATLASNSAVLSAISPAFTSTSTFTCVANDITTRANPVQVANTSSSSITITNTTGASDVISWICVGY